MIKKVYKGILVPTKKINGKFFGSAIYSKDGEFIMQQRNNKNMGHKTFNEKKINTNGILCKNETIIYMGQLTFHYGHFLLESLCRFWIFLDKYSKLVENKNKCKYAFTNFLINEHSKIEYSYELKKIANILKIDFKKFILIRQRFCFKEIIIYDSSSEIYDYINKKHVELFQKLVNNILERNLHFKINLKKDRKYKNLYLSRKMNVEYDII